MRWLLVVALLLGCGAKTKPPAPTDDLELDPALAPPLPPPDAGAPAEPPGDAGDTAVRLEVVEQTDAGPRIDLAVRDADVADVLRMIAAAAKIGLVVSDDVRARVTLEVSHVTWRQAIDVIAQLEGLEVSEDDGIVTVTRP